MSMRAKPLLTLRAGKRAERRDPNELIPARGGKPPVLPLQLDAIGLACGAEAARRGLPNLKTTPDALPALIDSANVALFEKYGVLNEAELHARYVAKAEQYAKLINIEANVMCDMARRLYVPAIMAYAGDIASDLAAKDKIGITSIMEEELCQKLNKGADTVWKLTDALEKKNAAVRGIEDPAALDEAYRDEVLPAMEELRAAVDDMEVICSKNRWPVPSYNDMLFYV